MEQTSLDVVRYFEVTASTGSTKLISDARHAPVIPTISVRSSCTMAAAKYRSWVSS